ncbi:hypothetical protein GCK72_024090 [Caenorhabditis remanei]|uniref:Uncharacterized protein n=1 Tax=Caenorhabditis remanei TaxID=31234 RepID=A0A6A5FYR4_CAERE|nr:hypothetical protein GCK72_024090 [Caenorhabditis remanei]KAF1747625.1 hypothetical protein GCK72_024090 [Caenorhabditis remanei]
MGRWSSSGCGGSNYFFLRLGVDGGVNLLELINGAHTENADSAGDEVNGFWSVLLVLLNLTENLLELLHLLLGSDNLEWVNLNLVSLLVELLDEHLVFARVNNVFLWSSGLKCVDGMSLGLLKLFVLEGVGVDGLWSDKLSLLLAFLALRSGTKSVSGFWASDALVEVDRLGVDGLLSFLNDGVSDFTISFHCLLVNIEETGILLGFHVLLLLVQLVNWSRSVENEAISHLNTEWKFDKLLELIRKLEVFQRLHLWPLLGLWEMGSRVGDIGQLKTYSLFGEKVRSKAGEAAIAKATREAMMIDFIARVIIPLPGNLFIQEHEIDIVLENHPNLADFTDNLHVNCRFTSLSVQSEVLVSGINVQSTSVALLHLFDVLNVLDSYVTAIIYFNNCCKHLRIKTF